MHLNISNRFLHKKGEECFHQGRKDCEAKELKPLAGVFIVVLAVLWLLL